MLESIRYYYRGGCGGRRIRGNVGSKVGNSFNFHVIGVQKLGIASILASVPKLYADTT